MLQQDASATWIGTRYTRSCSSQTWLYQPHLRWAWSKNQRAVLPRHVADAEAATAICIIAGDVFVFQQDNAPAHHARDTLEFLRSKTPQFISPDLNPVNYCTWGMLQERIYRTSSTNPRYGQIAEASCCDMGWILAEHGGRCSWSVTKKTGSMCTRARVGGHFEHLLWHCLPDMQLPHITTPGSFPSHRRQPTIGSLQIHQRFEERNFSQMKKFSILQGSVVTFFRCGG